MRAANPQFAQCSWRQAVELFVDDVEARVVEWFAYWYVFFQFLHLVLSDEDSTLRGAIAVVQSEVLWRCQRGQFLAGCYQVQQRVIVVAGGKLVGHLCSHERMGDMIGLEVGIYLRQRQPDVVTYYIHAGTAGQRGVHVHHATVETITGIARHVMLSLEFKPTLIPMTERSQIAVLQLTALRQSRRARGVKQDEEVFRAGDHGLRFCSRQRETIFRQQHLTVVFVNDIAQRLIGYQQLGIGIFNHKVQALGRITRVKGLVGTAGLEHAESSNRHPLTAWNDDRHHILATETSPYQISRYALCDIVYLAVGISLFVIHHRYVVGRQLHLTAEQRDDGLRCVIRHLSIVETVKQGCLIPIE